MGTDSHRVSFKNCDNNLKTMTSMTLFALVLLAMCAGTYCFYWDNDYDEDHEVTCPIGHTVDRIRSTHNNGKEDRRWKVECQNTGFDDGCQWSTDLNEMDEDVLYMCPENGVVAGWRSRHANKQEDRIFAVYCCRKANTIPQHCFLTPWVNDWDRDMDFKTGGRKAITAVHSVHSNSKEDRRWKFIYCSV